MYEITVTKKFSAAHKLLGYEGDCAKLHGHNWIVDVAVAGDSLNEQGMLIDFGKLKKLISQVINDLDHCYLNEMEIFNGSSAYKNPTAENISRYIFQELKKIIVPLNGVILKRVTVWESPNASATFREENINS